MTTRGNARDQLLDEPGCRGMGWKITATATASGLTASTTDPRVARAAVASEGLTGYWLYFPSGASANQVRMIASVSVSSGTTTITTDGPNYNETLTGVTAYILSVDPNHINSLFNDALAELFTEFEIPLAHGPTDYDMSAAADTDWTESGATDTKTTTAADVFSGRQAMTVANAGAGDYTRSGVVRLGQSRKALFFGVWKADVGTGVLRLRDSANTSLDTLSHDEEEFVYGAKLYAGSSTVEGVELDLEGTESTADIDWDCAGIVRPEDYIFRLPSWIDHRFNLRAVCKARWHTSKDTNLWYAFSKTLEALQEGVHYRYIRRPGEANPYAIELTEQGHAEANLTEHPLWLVGLRPYSDIATFSDDTTSHPVPEDELVAKVKVYLGLSYRDKFPALAEIADREERKAKTNARTEEPPQERWSGPIGGRRI